MDDGQQTGQNEGGQIMGAEYGVLLPQGESLCRLGRM